MSVCPSGRRSQHHCRSRRRHRAGGHPQLEHGCRQTAAVPGHQCAGSQFTTRRIGHVYSVLPARGRAGQSQLLQITDDSMTKINLIEVSSPLLAANRPRLPTGGGRTTEKGKN
ncbi:hypothetical protein BaRGS_00018291 [Batillaria attramentaria]|uniref:Uncharacterized protein n=1 Tax=Batillaria attramentaria TaxID=370345 RepID=A0ABD0KTK2_9CAEN